MYRENIIVKCSRRVLFGSGRMGAAIFYQDVKIVPNIRVYIKLINPTARLIKIGIVYLLYI